MSEWIDTKDQAKLIRAALKREFPGTAFSVRISRYSGGSSVRVEWTDGPTVKSVAGVANTFDGRRFDGMYDLGYAAAHYLMPDGSSIFAHDVGGYDNLKREGPAPDGGKLVQYAGSVSCYRRVSEAWELEILAELATVAEVPVESLLWNGGHANGNVKLPVSVEHESDGARIFRMADDTRNYVSQLLWQVASLRTRGSVQS